MNAEYASIGPKWIGKVLYLVDARTNTYALLMQDGKLANCIADVLEPATERDYEMARGAAKSAEAKKAEKEAKDKPNNLLIDGIKFVLPGFRENAEAYAKHAMIYGGYITSYDGIVCYGHPIGQENAQLFAMPHLGRLAAAVKTAGDKCSIVQVDQTRLSIKSGKFRVFVECVADHKEIFRPVADTAVGGLDRRMRDALEAVRAVTDKSAEFVLEASVVIRDKSAVAFSRKLIVEFWHGLPFPTLVVPAEFVEAVLKSTLPITGFGFSDASLTLWFENGAFMRTQLYKENIPPELDNALPAAWDRAQPIPDEFFSALDKLAPFADREYIYAANEKLQTHHTEEHGAQMEVPGLVAASVMFDRKLFSKIKGRAKHFDYFTDPTRTFFWGENLRGTVMNFVAAEGKMPPQAELNEPAEPAYGAAPEDYGKPAEAYDPNAQAHYPEPGAEAWQQPQPATPEPQPAAEQPAPAPPGGMVFGKPAIV